jgi:oligoribonuclease (3'-5' exoribonuclease)
MIISPIGMIGFWFSFTLTFNFHFNPVDKVVNVLHKQGVGVSTIYESKKTMIPMLKEYSTKVGYKKGAKNFIKEVIKKLSKK